MNGMAFTLYDGRATWDRAGKSAGATFSAVTDFSIAQNPSGAWSYGYRATGGSFTTFSSNANTFGAGADSWTQSGTCCPMATRNNTGATYQYPNAPTVVQPSDVLNLHPGPSGERGVVKWTAPAAGTYTVSGRFQGIDTGGTTSDVSITKNGATLFSGQVNGYGTQLPFSLSVTVAAGDAVEFTVGVGSNGTYNNDSTGLAATIVQQVGSADVEWLVAD